MPSFYIEKPSRSVVEALVDARATPGRRPKDIDALACSLLSPEELRRYEMLIVIRAISKSSRAGRAQAQLKRQHQILSFDVRSFISNVRELSEEALGTLLPGRRRRDVGHDEDSDGGSS